MVPVPTPLTVARVGSTMPSWTSKGPLLLGGRPSPIAMWVLALIAIGCSPDKPAISPAVLASAPSPAPPRHLGAADIVAALDTAAAAGPVRFTSFYSLAATGTGYSQTMSRTDGVMDVTASRGIAIRQDLPGTALSTKNEIALAGNRLFSRTKGVWEERYGGARSFVALDVPGDSVMAVITAALTDSDSWVVIASESDDPPGSIRVRRDPGSGPDVAVVIDVAGRLVLVVASPQPREPGGGRAVHELTFTEFGVLLEFVPPS